MGFFSSERKGKNISLWFI